MIKFFNIQPIIIAVLILFCLLSGVRGFEQQSVEASTNTQLEFRVRQLESQLSRLESQVNRLSATQSSPRPIIQVEPDEVEGNTIESEGRQSWISGDPLFDRLATLVIELKQDIQDLQQRVQQLESG
jgi:outer membrane murein-binding lipoprotein Lpp